MVKSEFRIEKDALGEVAVPKDKYWGAQTQRAHENFQIGFQKMPIEVIYALAEIKKAAARANFQLGFLSKEKMEIIQKVAEEIIDGKLDEHFPLVVWQTGSGTQTNMNLNEVISNRAIEKLGGIAGSKIPIHPNDDVNKSQSSNDVFPSAMHISTLLLLRKKLIPNLKKLYEGFKQKSIEFQDIVKVGRTHLMDAAPLTLGQEFSGYASQLEQALRGIEKNEENLFELALGATAVGTGLNSHPDFAKIAITEISNALKINFRQARNTFAALAADDGIVLMSSALKQVAVALLKIGNDIRLLASGPRSGIGEITLPANEPGSSIMPGKVNPTQCEALTMVATQVMGSDLTISIAGSLGNFELNVFKPVMIYNLLNSIHLIGDVCLNFYQKCLVGIKPNLKRIKEHLDNSLMLATALNTVIGYDKASQIVKKAYEEEISLKKAAIELGFLTEKEFDKIIDPAKMIFPNIK